MEFDWRSAPFSCLYFIHILHIQTAYVFHSGHEDVAQIQDHWARTQHNKHFPFESHTCSSRIISMLLLDGPHQKSAHTMQTTTTTTSIQHRASRASLLLDAICERLSQCAYFYTFAQRQWYIVCWIGCFPKTRLYIINVLCNTDRFSLALTLNSLKHIHTNDIYIKRYTQAAHTHRQRQKIHTQAQRMHDLYKCLVCVHFPLFHAYIHWQWRRSALTDGRIVLGSFGFSTRRRSIHFTLDGFEMLCMRFSLFCCFPFSIAAAACLPARLTQQAYMVHRALCLVFSSDCRSRRILYTPNFCVFFSRLSLSLSLVLYTGQCVLCLPGRVRLPSFGFHFHLATVRESTAREVVAFSS